MGGYDRRAYVWVVLAGKIKSARCVGCVKCVLGCAIPPCIDGGVGEGGVERGRALGISWACVRVHVESIVL